MYLHKIAEYKKHFGLNQCDMQEIMSFVYQCSTSQVIALSEKEFLNKEQKLLAALYQIKEGKPLEYVLGYKNFYSLKLKVNPSVLIPRHETEILVHKMVQRYQKKAPKVIFDVCCGSGAIGLSLKKAFQSSQLYLSDICSEALKVAQENASAHFLKVSLFQGDLLAPFEGLKADLIVCNPPYVPIEDYSFLEKSVKHYEPKKALLAKNDGLEFYERLFHQLPLFLNGRGCVVFEIGFNQKKSLKSLFSKKPYKNLIFEKDFSGHDRFFFLEIE